MKTRNIMILLATIMLLVSACGSREAKQNESSEKTDNKTEGNEKIEVDKNLLDVEVTLPESFFKEQEQDIAQVIAEAESEGISVTKNSDGSLTYKMSKAKHKEMMSELENQTKTSIEEMKNSEDFASIKDVEYNKSFSEITLVVIREKYEGSFDGFAVLGVAISSMLYQMFDGVNPDDYKVTIFLKDADTGEVFDTIIYPEALEQ
ncbi:hypothetical protein J27TS8_38970 [Robertmurraya siralis]|uniref:Antigen I/II N-terminal domain-containing protein n=1 Tax=Robertmurraya siralis TaxID=77777 RepID=A0A920BV99_9BACI|nr:hypothetical protein [Robertmurraya siralis]GIN63904.1 hypothetical protein J27TS8_38970 [Robertmurraya siralis]